jgi:hypothetical protein
MYHHTLQRNRSAIKDWKAAALKGPELPAFGHAVAGATGAAVSTLATYPLDLIITRLQIQRQLRRRGQERDRRKSDTTSLASAGEPQPKGSTIEPPTGGSDDGVAEYKNVLDAACKIYEAEGGLSGLYTGIVQATGKTIAESFVFFLTYTFLRQRRLKSKGLNLYAVLPVLDELTVGFLAGALTKLLTTPISTILTRKQTEGLVSKTQASTAKDIANQILAEKGLKGFWCGYSASLVLTLNPSITFCLNELFKYSLVPRSKRKNPPASATFFLAAISKVIASSITYPFSLAKSRAQAAATSSQVAGNSEGKEANTSTPTVFHIVSDIARSEGVGALYAGLQGEILRGFFSHGITMLVKDIINTSVIQVYYILLTLLRRYPTPEDLIQRAKMQSEEFANIVKEHAADTAKIVTEGGEGPARKIVEGGKKAAEDAIVGVNADEDAFFSTAKEAVHETYMNETAELVGDYVEDEAEEWRSLYHWFWERERRKHGGDS